MLDAPRILIVDDDEDDRYFLTEAIHTVDLDAIITERHNGEEAIEYLEKTCKEKQGAKPDIIFLDLNMVRVDGRVVAKIIKDSKDFCHIPVIIITTTQNKAERDALIAIGANEFYTKPTSVRELTDIVAQVYKKYLA